MSNETDKNVMRKKREVLPFIHAIIMKLTEMSKDAATLEYNDNEQASLRLKRDYVHLRENEFLQLHKHIIGIREEINYKPTKKTRNNDTDKTVHAD